MILFSFCCVIDSITHRSRFDTTRASTHQQNKWNHHQKFLISFFINSKFIQQTNKIKKLFLSHRSAADSFISNVIFWYFYLLMFSLHSFDIYKIIFSSHIHDLIHLSWWDFHKNFTVIRKKHFHSHKLNFS